MIRLGEVWLNRKGDLVYIPDRRRPPFTATTPIELRNMLVNAVIKISREEAGSKVTLHVRPTIPCMYPKRHRHDKGEPYTDSEILLARQASEIKARRQSSGNRKPDSAPHRAQRRGAQDHRGVQRRKGSRG